MNIDIAGASYVGQSNTKRLTQHNEVVAIAIVPGSVAMLNARQSPIEGTEIEDFSKNKPSHFRSTPEKVYACTCAYFDIVANPYDFGPATNYFNTHLIESAVTDMLAINTAAVMVPKSGGPARYTVKVLADTCSECAASTNHPNTASAVP